MKFPPAFLERLRSALPVSAVVGKRVPLKRHGREFQGLCPFHQEKTPSFTVNDDKGFYHCFGCGAHGDGLNFLMQYERLEYPQAIEALAREAGIALPAPEPGMREAESRLKRLYEVCEAAAVWFSAQLGTQGGAAARRYLESRGVTDGTIAAFRIGYAPDGREGLLKTLLAKGFDVPLQHTAGLLSKTDDGRYYDRFRGRVIFPIADDRGRVIAFGGRILGDGKPKYLNSAETPLFHKSDRLYAFHHARRPMGDEGRAVLVEGYMDVVALHQAGIETAVAPMGTAVTPEQLTKLWAAASEVVVCLDGDDAGIRAALKTADTALPLLKAGKSLAVAPLPRGQDPDDIIRQSGAEGMRSLLHKARSLAEVLWFRESRSLTPLTPERKAACDKALHDLAERIADPTVRRHYQAFFREKLWEATAAARQTARGKEKSRGGAPRKPETRSASLSAPERSEEETCLATLIHLVLLAPALLDDGEVETGWQALAPENPQLASLHAETLVWAAEPEGTLADHLARCGLGEAAARLARQVDPLRQLAAEPEVLKPLWHETLRALHASQLNRESGRDLGEELTEAAWARLVAARRGES